jgi:ribosomal subunit interface protein
MWGRRPGRPGGRRTAVPSPDPCALADVATTDGGGCLGGSRPAASTDQLTAKEVMRVDIVVKGRHTEVAERFRMHVIDKLDRLQRFDHKVIRLDVEVCHESNPRLHDQSERVELTCHSRGPVIRAEAAAADPYAALDLAYEKLQTRLRRLADRRRVHHGRKNPASLSSAATVVTEPPGSVDGSDVDDGDDLERQVGVLPAEAIGGVEGDGPLVVREKTHVAAPMTLDQALLEMELVGHDFYLFHDKESGLPSVVYRRRGYDYGVIRLDREE